MYLPMLMNVYRSWPKIVSAFLIGIVAVNFTPFAQANYQDVTNNDWFYPYTQQLVGAGIIATNPNFFPHRYITRAELAKMATKAAEYQHVLNIAPANNTFCDVAISHWANIFIQTLFARGAVQGHTASCQQGKVFYPENYVTRAEALKILLGVYRISVSGNGSAFSDIPTNSWYAPYVSTAASMNLINSSGNFRPHDNLTRAEMSKIIVRLSEYITAHPDVTNPPSSSSSPTSTATSSPTPTIVVPSVPSSTTTSARYNIGTPTVQDLWVDSRNGNNENDGSRNQPKATIAGAWREIPEGRALSITGYRINVLSDDNNTDAIWLENRIGTGQFPIIIQSATSEKRLVPPLNIFNSKYVYVLGIKTVGNGGDLFHCEKCDYLLLRDSIIEGRNRGPQEAVKINQSQHVYLENNDISGAHDNAIDLVAVQYGHISGNKVHDAEDWCAYTKGGSAYFVVEGNEFYDCGTGGFTAGQGTGIEYMTPPWVHYEAYDIKVYNNVIHDTEGAGLGVNGGFNILLAYNTLYRVGSRSHGIEVVFGGHTCDGETAGCNRTLAAGGWGSLSEEVFIGNKNVYIYNNILYNPAGYQSQWQHFAIYEPRNNPTSSQGPRTAVTDDNLQIKGNIIWNGPSDLSLGLEACQNNHPTCSETQIKNDNSINTVQPQFTNASGLNFTLSASSNVKTTRTFSIPSFTWTSIPANNIPQGTLSNAVTKRKDGSTRGGNDHAGAY
ncbi:MAG: S-layer homology domain-containing protein [Candidatus Abawacabacteria bacterium]|nr:S-layer homology domain-containing protein [Candidatus Abawacabacteria bacterium]